RLALVTVVMPVTDVPYPVVPLTILANIAAYGRRVVSRQFVLSAPLSLTYVFTVRLHDNDILERRARVPSNSVAAHQKCANKRYCRSCPLASCTARRGNVARLHPRGEIKMLTDLKELRVRLETHFDIIDDENEKPIALGYALAPRQGATGGTLPPGTT